MRQKVAPGDSDPPGNGQDDANSPGLVPLPGDIAVSWDAQADKVRGDLEEEAEERAAVSPPPGWLSFRRRRGVPLLRTNVFRQDGWTSGAMGFVVRRT
jgi:hypothetical protein